MRYRLPIRPVRRGLAVGVLGLFLATPSLSAQSSPSETRVPRNDSFPLAVGNSWTYSGTLWWTPTGTRRVLKEQVTWVIEVDEVIERPGVRAAVLTGLPNDLVLLGTGRARGEFLLVQLGEDQLHLLRGERQNEVLERLRDPDDDLEDLVLPNELVLDLPLFAGKTFCPGGGPPRGAGAGCWIVRDVEPFELRSIRGLHGTRERFTLDLTSRGEHVVWGFVPGVGLTSYAIGHFGSVSAVELDLVAADLEGHQPIVFLKTLDVEHATFPDEGLTIAPDGEPEDPAELGTGAEPEIGAEPEAVVETRAAPPPPPDTDGDGVSDARDQCPETPDGAEVNEYGCQVPGDADGDGVTDARDQCPDTAPEAAVNEYGCPIPGDADGDGVVDPRDVCPETPAGAEVDAYGCEIVHDADGDGVVDPRDLCDDTAAGTEVDAYGCEVVRDSDDDGVPDPRDTCPDTPAGEPVDSSGCTPPEPEAAEPEPQAAEPEPAQPEPEPADADPAAADADPAAAEPIEVDVPVAVEVAIEPTDQPACVDRREWFLTRRPIVFDERQFEPTGGPEPISLGNLVIVGGFEGVPIFAASASNPPYSEIWLPFCSPAGSYQLYAAAGG